MSGQVEFKTHELIMWFGIQEEPILRSTWQVARDKGYHNAEPFLL